VRAVTLHQPWASLVAFGVKSFETRSWPPLYRGPLAIHAGKSREGAEFFDEVAAPLLAPLGVERFDDLPFGAVVALVDLTAYFRTDDLERWLNDDRARAAAQFLDGTGELLTPRERELGDFSCGRWAWRLEDPRRLERPEPARGYQKLWTWKAA